MVKNHQNHIGETKYTDKDSTFYGSERSSSVREISLWQDDPGSEQCMTVLEKHVLILSKIKIVNDRQKIYKSYIRN
jgi:hypothetical protein